MLSHVGGAPVEEVLLVLIPVSALAALLFFANRRANRALEARAEVDAVDPQPVSVDPDLSDVPEVSDVARRHPTP